MARRADWSKQLTHHIVRIQAGHTKAQKPMWKCTLQDGQTVNFFAEQEPLFRAAGYPELLALPVDTRLNWHQHPIRIELSQNGQWLNVAAVYPRSDGAEPDAPYEPNRWRFRQSAISTAALLLRYSDEVVIVDVETTGLDATMDEMISITVIDAEGCQVAANTLIRPEQPYRETGAEQVHHLSPEMLANAPCFANVETTIFEALDGKVWVSYGIDFDRAFIEHTFARHDAIMPTPRAVLCAMDLFARWFGEWDADRQKFVPKSLAFAVEHLGITLGDSRLHESLGDALLTRAVLNEMIGAGEGIEEIHER